MQKTQLDALFRKFKAKGTVANQPGWGRKKKLSTAAIRFLHSPDKCRKYQMKVPQYNHYMTSRVCLNKKKKEFWVQQ